MRKYIQYFIIILILLISFELVEAQTQSDTSDAVWSIVMPIATSHDIDMRQCIAGNQKDSLIDDVSINSGNWKFRVDSIYFRGGDAIYFNLESGFPVYYVEPGKSHPAEIRFKPTQARMYQAEIVIITQADTLIQRIIGEGIEPKLEILSKYLISEKLNWEMIKYLRILL